MANQDFILSLRRAGVPASGYTIAKHNDKKYDHIIVQRADGSLADSFFYDRITGEVIEKRTDIHTTSKVSWHSSSSNFNSSTESIARESTSGGPMKRSRGRPKRHSPYAIEQHNSASSSSTVIQVFKPYSNEPQNFALGDFVAEKDNYFSGESFPIYAISLGNMLQKYDSVVRGGATLHEISSRFLAYKDNDILKTSFVKIEVSILSYKGRNPDVVQISKDCLPPRIDETLRDNLLVYVFKIYIQCLLSLSMDSAFLEKVKNQEYFSDSMEQIDYLLSCCSKHILTRVSLNDKVLQILDRLPFFRVEGLCNKSMNMRCEASNDNSLMANRVLILSGPTYDPDTLKNRSGSSERVEYLVNDQILDLVLTYHGIKHFKYHMFLESISELNYRRTKHADDGTIVEKCLGNNLWIQLFFEKLTSLAKKCNFELEISEECQYEL